MDPILKDIKKLLGILDGDKHFDNDLLIHINTGFFKLHQIGVGPEQMFIVDENKVWEDFQEDKLPIVRSYIYLFVKLLFDPPATSFHLTAINEQMREFEWRLYVHADRKKTSC